MDAGAGVRHRRLDRGRLRLAPKQPATAEDVLQRTLLFNVTSGQEDVHAATMALMAASNSLDAGWSTILYFDVHAPVLASRNLSNNDALASERPAKELLAAAMSKGAKVFVCPHCMQVAGVEAEVLVEGANPAALQAVLDQLRGDVIFLSY
ncbi:DsrE family protein [Sorangium sp. So ce375]|uniref:DsrE family protein n=1 Tax=Sorangium sp. So ce375 TaxID=3133306 RepID=UPI003F5BA8B5